MCAVNMVCLYTPIIIKHVNKPPKNERLRLTTHKKFCDCASAILFAIAPDLLPLAID